MMGEVNFEVFSTDPEDPDAAKVVVTDPENLATLSAWVTAVADYRDRVRSCPWVAETNLQNLSESFE